MWRCAGWFSVREVRRRGLVLIGALVLALAVGFAGQGEALDISGTYQLDTVFVPIPATLVDEIQLDTPAELTVFKVGIESTLDLSVTFWDAVVHLNTAMNIAGLERFILDMTAPLGPLLLKPEIWFAVPFETVMDINHFTNWVVVPPGDLMFVKARITAEADILGVDVNNLLMIEDVTFPDPGADFGPLEYETFDQTFHVGDILTVTTDPYPGITLTSTTLFCASLATNAVKGWSARGSVCPTSSLCDDFCFNQRLSLTGLEYCGVSLWFTLGINPCDEPILELSGGGAMSGLWSLDLSSAFSLFPLDISGFSFQTTLCDVIDASIQLGEDFSFQSASLRSQANIDTGIMQGSAFSSCTLIAGEGLTALSLGASLTHGTISGSLNWAFCKQNEEIRLGSVTSRLQFRFAPAAISTSLVFGRRGLVRATLSGVLSF